MTRGRAFGKNRDYQAFCRDVLQESEPSLKPVSGDGLDVPLELGGTTWSFDVALKGQGKRIIVAECRRRKEPVKQEDLAAFAFKLCLLRQKRRSGAVAGVFFAKSKYQIGAIRAASLAGISMATVGDNNNIESGFTVEYHRLHHATGRRMRDIRLRVRSGNLRVTGSNAELDNSTRTSGG